MQQSANASVLARMQIFDLKIATIYTLLEGEEAVGPDAIEVGSKVSRYLAESALFVAGGIGSTDRSRLLNRIEQIISGWPEPRSIGYLRRQLSQHQRAVADSLGGLKRLCDQLVADGRTEHDQGGGGYWVDPAAA